ncbi:phosphomevalonate kinase [Arthrobotrys conoides]|uniref:Phosphomevalonate kinase n=1 Tax=Arthrobotrys conoides TaxID=74498 RepID=A0AAN8NPI8_9PEZI
MSKSTAVSAPGKVLLAGGYTVLDPSCRGLVFALSARIHCVATPSNDPSATPGKITVRSPQFQDAVWEYQVSTSDEDGGKAVSVVQTNDGDPNPFVLTTLKYTLSYLSLPVPPPTTLTILADNPYYSQPPPPIPRFNSLPFPIKSAYKTGLGSSAALVTSLTSSILLHFLPTSSPKLPPHIFHNLAQASHCAAQGKVGSGFDVAAATYGSCIYRRFPPEILTAIPDPADPTFSNILRETVDKPWTSMESTPITLPSQIGLIMGDVQCGSSTPGMVKTVLSWRKSGGEDAETTWKALNSRNEDLISTIKDIINSNTQEPSTTTDTIKQRITAIREMVRELGSKASVEIEPESQTKLLDAAADQVDGVIGGVVPGAGGFDAVCFLYERKEGVEQNLREFLGNWKVENGVVKALELGQEGEGVRVEKVEGYRDVKAYFEGIAEL